MQFTLPKTMAGRMVRYQDVRRCGNKTRTLEASPAQRSEPWHASFDKPLDILSTLHEHLVVPTVGISDISAFAPELPHRQNSVRREVCPHVALGNKNERGPVDLLLCPRDCEMVGKSVVSTERLYCTARKRMSFT